MKKGRPMSFLVIIILVAISIILLIFIGLNIKPKSYVKIDYAEPELDYQDLPQELPAPVEKFYKLTYGEKIPVIKTATLSGRGTMDLGIKVPIRFRFTHESGRNFRHDIDLTFFGIPIFKAYETYIDGVGEAKTPGGIDKGEGFEQGSNVSLWMETLTWFPAALLTDNRVKWESFDDDSAALTVPYKDKEQKYLIRFNSETGKPQYSEAMKYNSQKKKEMFWVSGTWFEDGKPWIELNVEDVKFNLDVVKQIREGWTR